jgi:hypothetical protein
MSDVNENRIRRALQRADIATSILILQVCNFRHCLCSSPREKFLDGAAVHTVCGLRKVRLTGNIGQIGEEG